MTIQFDVAVVGAGMAGLTCAQQLAQAGFRVVVLEKSRGVGGRMATRRLNGTFADHGTCYLTPKGELFWGLIERLINADVLHVWTEIVHELDADGNLYEPGGDDRYPRYVAAKGMTAIAKFLANGLDICLGQRVQTLALQDSGWQLTSVSSTDEKTTVQARAMVVAIPAPQALMLLQPLTEVLSQKFIQTLAAVEFSPCLSVMAGYSRDRQQDWLTQYPNISALTFHNDNELAWIGLDSSKRSLPPLEPVFVVQSTAMFAEQHLEADNLEPIGHQLLKHASERLAPWLAMPEWLQIHRWRYAFAKSPLANHCLPAATPFPLVCAGDWCGGMKVEQAFLSGLAAAEQIQRSLNKATSQ